MRVIDIASWPRRRHFDLFNAYDAPHFGLCAPVDVTTLWRVAAERDCAVTVALVYLLSKAANDVPEFRCRIRGAQVVEHDIVHPSTTVLTREELFGFCPLQYEPDFARFAPAAVDAMARAAESAILEDDPGRDDLLFMTAVPWIAFTGVVHAMRLRPTDSVPRIAWGRATSQHDRKTMPLAVQVHHALVDGLHVGRYYERVQELLSDADRLLAT